MEFHQKDKSRVAMCIGTQLLRMNLCHLKVDKYFMLVLKGTIWEEGSEQWKAR